MLTNTAGPALSWSDVDCHLVYGNAAASATAGIWRIVLGDWSAVVKVLRHGREGSPAWQSGTEVDHWYYWRREALVYSSDLVTAADGLLRTPRCFGVFERLDGSSAIWLEDLETATSAAAWNLERYRESARALGRFQARSAGSPPDHPWLAHQWLRRYVERREAFLSALADDQAWSHPLVREHFPAGTREEISRLWRAREELLGLIYSMGECLTHSDLHPGNLFSSGPQTVIIDWGFAGIGPLGEDPGNLVFDAILDFFVRPGEFELLCEAVFGGYVEGVTEAGWTGDPDQLRRAMWAVGAVKYLWIPPVMVETLAVGRQSLNRRPTEEAFAWWAPLVGPIIDFGLRALA